MKKIKIIILTLSIILILVVCIFLFNTSDEKISFSSNQYTESLALNGDLTATLVWYMRTNFSSISEDYNYLYENDYLLASDIDKEYLMNIILYRLDRLQEIEDGVVSEELFKEQFEVVFGSNVEYEVVDSFNYMCSVVKYDSEEEQYYFTEDENCNTESNIVSSAIASYVYDDRIEIVQAIGYVASDGTYYDYELENKVTDEILNEDTMRGNDHLFKRYKFIYNYDEETDSYYFYSVERYEGNV